MSTPQSDPAVPARPARSAARVLADRFELGRALGSGISGTVYEAFDRTHQAQVALKLMHGRAGDPLVRFKREFRALQTVRHPNIVSFGELFSDGDEWFFTMELLEGIDFRAFVRRADGVDEARVRATVRQLAEALATLHAAGIVHRDVKPANVVVSGDGRATLLDFGVVKDPRSMSHSAPELVSFVGTPGYMAPEQISGDAEAPADCYAVGVMLYEALVGQLPFTGKVSDVLQAKQTRPPAPPIALAPSVPHDLSDLALDLLAIDPSVRPTAEAIARRVARTALTSSAPPSGRARPFVGRDVELAALHAACDEALRDGARAALVEGESGIGKSALARRFVRELREREPRAVVLVSRCRETEWIPYKAFDGLVDSLSRFLRTLPDAQAAALVPMRVSLVVQAFPVLARVPAFACDPPSRGSDADLVRQRRLLFAAVRELLGRVAQRHALVLYIDDLQWADADSMAMLGEVTRGPEAPPIFVVATTCTGGIDAASPPKCVRDALRVPVGPLPVGAATELALRLATASDATAAIDARAIARDTDGHPLFIAEIVRQAIAGGTDPASPRLDDALAARVAALDPSARELLECVALAARPMPRAVLARATSLHGNDTYRIANALSSANLVRVSGAHAERLEPYHDRVRLAVLRELEHGRAAKRHRRIAAALELDAPDNEALAYHWREANKPERAAPYAERAAVDAERALAFDQAAIWYRMALDLGAPAGEARAALLAKLGDALANAGRSAHAAIAYREAASCVDASAAVTHLQKAADQLLRAGDLEEGFALAYELFDRLGVRAPRARWALFASFLFWRCFFAVRGLRFRERSSAEIAPRDLARVDTAWSITSALCTVDPIRGAYFQVRHLRMALAAGEPYRVVRAAALQIGYRAGPGADARLTSERFAEHCAALSERIGDPRGVALTQLAAGVAAYLQGRFARAVDLLDDAERRLRAQPGTWGEIARARRFALAALANLGSMRELRERVHMQLRDARAHGDLHATTNLRVGHPNLVWLMDDDVAAARAELARAMTARPLRGFQLEHHYALFAEANIDLYAGAPARARAVQLASWRDLERSFLLRIAAARVVALSARARVAIALAEREPREAKALLREASRIAGQIERDRVPYAAPTSALLRAGIAATRGRAAEAFALAESAESAFEALGMRLMAAAARRSGAAIFGGDAGAAVAREVDAWMENEDIVCPRRMTAMLAPGFAHFASFLAA